MKEEFTPKLGEKQGSILILTLWVLTFLTVFTIQVATKVNQRIALLSHLEDQSQLRLIASSGIKKAIAALRLDYFRGGGQYSAYNKSYRHNNFEKFSSIPIGNGLSHVSYPYYMSHELPPQTRFGFIDEESKINLNTVDRITLRALLELAAGVNGEQAQGLAESIVDWREIGHTQLQGFNSDDYYAGLLHPYQNKEAPFELIDELLLIKGMRYDIYERLIPFVTIYGDGLININTASKTVLMALGLESHVADKLMQVRWGTDGIEATEDDHVFRNAYDVTSEVQSVVSLEKDEVIQIEFLNGGGKIKTNSSFYFIESHGKLDGTKRALSVSCVYNVDENMVEYWREK